MMARTGTAILTAIGMAVVGGGAWMLAGSGAMASASSAPTVMLDVAAEKAKYRLLDAAAFSELRDLDRLSEQSTGRNMIQSKKEDDGVTWTVELDDITFVTVKAKINPLSDTKSELDVAVRLEDSPFTEDYGLLPSDRKLLEDALDGTLTEEIAARLEERRVDRRLMKTIETRLEMATLLDRKVFEQRMETAFEGAIKPRLEKLEKERGSYRSSSRQDHSDYSAYEQQSRMRESQRDASRPTATTEPMTQLPTNN